MAGVTVDMVSAIGERARRCAHYEGCRRAHLDGSHAEGLLDLSAGGAGGSLVGLGLGARLRGSAAREVMGDKLGRDEVMGDGLGAG